MSYSLRLRGPQMWRPNIMVQPGNIGRPRSVPAGTIHPGSAHKLTTGGTLVPGLCAPDRRHSASALRPSNSRKMLRMAIPCRSPCRRPPAATIWPAAQYYAALQCRADRHPTTIALLCGTKRWRRRLYPAPVWHDWHHMSRSFRAVGAKCFNFPPRLSRFADVPAGSPPHTATTTISE